MFKCDKCKDTIQYKTIRKDGLPNGISFELDDGKVVTLCMECLRALGRTSREGAAKFAEDLGIERNKKK